MSQTRVKIRRKKQGNTSLIVPTAEEIAAFGTNATEGYLPTYEEVEVFRQHVGVVRARIYSSLPPTANDLLACPMTPEGMMMIVGTMRAVVEAEGASYGVPCNGRGFIIAAPNAKGTYAIGGPDDGLKVTDDLVLVFDDVMIKPHATEGEPPYVDVARIDLCPNIRHVRLSDHML